MLEMIDFPRGGFRLRLILAAVSLAVVSVTAAPQVQAQNSDLQSLIQRVDRLQREIVTLQRQVYSSGEAPAPASELANLGPDTGGEVPPRIAARLQTRVDELEAQLRSLTGQIEEANFQARQVASRLDKLIGDVDFRLQELERRVGGGIGAPLAEGDPAAQPSGAGFAAGGAGGTSGPQVLGQVSQAEVDALRARQQQQQFQDQAQAGQVEAQAGQVQGQVQSDAAAAPAAQQTAALPGGSVQADYNHAFGLLSKANYGEAEVALKSFLETHPDDPLAGNAKYWLGETYYVRGDFRNAAVTFAEGFQRYPDSTKAADNLLKLGMSLAQLEKKDDACGAFGELLKRYPDATTSILQRATRERERLGC